MNVLRGLFGMNDVQEDEWNRQSNQAERQRLERQKTKDTYSVEVNRSIRALGHQIAAMKDDLDDLNIEISTCAANGNRKKARALLLRKRKLEGELSIHEGKLINLKDTQQVVQHGQSNLDQADLTRQAADQVTDISNQLEHVNVQDAVDTIREGNVDINNVGRLLSEPIMDDEFLYGTDVEDVDVELERLMSGTGVTAVETETMYTFPSVPTTKPSLQQKHNNNNDKIHTKK